MSRPLNHVWPQATAKGKKAAEMGSLKRKFSRTQLKTPPIDSLDIRPESPVVLMNAQNDLIIKNATSTPIVATTSTSRRQQPLAGVSPLLYTSAASDSIERGVQEQEDEGDDDLLLINWSLPPTVLEWYHSKGITNMFRWQSECLKTGNALAGGNLVFSAPTSAGKTLVSDILLLQQVFESKRKVFIILPFVSVSREKTLTLESMLSKTSAKVGGFYGGQRHPGGIEEVDIAICTTETANNIINRLIQEKHLGLIGTIIVDEIHLLGDNSRGYLLELLLAKVLYLCKKEGLSIQVIGMSATLPNIDLLAKWLDADLYTTDFRPVPLSEKIKVGEIIYEAKTMKECSRMSDDNYLRVANDQDRVLALTIQTVTNGNGILIFWNDKKMVEHLAKKISHIFKHLGSNRERLKDKPLALRAYDKLRELLVTTDIQQVLAELKNTRVKLDPVLEETVSFGVGYHHAGLSMEEREIIEDAFKRGVLKVLVATSTLSSGVNLPARRVLIMSPVFGRSMMDIYMYKQMAGRAGRKGVDTEGECILICDESNKDIGQQLVQSPLNPIESCLVRLKANTEEGKDEEEKVSDRLRRGVLEVIVGGVVASFDDAVEYCNCTLMSASDKVAGRPVNFNLIEQLLKSLVDSQFVGKREVNQRQEYFPAQLGKGVVASSLAPEDGLMVLNQFEKAKKSLVLLNDLHLLYEVIPFSLARRVKVDWAHFRDIWHNLDEHSQHVASVVGIKFADLVQKSAVANANINTDVHNRFYLALALMDIVHEIPLATVCQKFALEKGQLQNLQENSSAFARMMATFCNKLGWDNLETLISQVQHRLQYGVRRELIDLMRITILTASIARDMYRSGFDSVAKLARSKFGDVEMKLKTASEFKLEKDMDTYVVWVPAKCKPMNMRELAIEVVLEAREIIERDHGVTINWDQSFSGRSRASGDSTSAATRSPLYSSVSVEEQHEEKSTVSFNKISSQLKERCLRGFNFGENSLSQYSLVDAEEDAIEVDLTEDPVNEVDNSIKIESIEVSEEIVSEPASDVVSASRHNDDVSNLPSNSKLIGSGSQDLYEDNSLSSLRSLSGKRSKAPDESSQKVKRSRSGSLFGSDSSHEIDRHLSTDSEHVGSDDEQNFVSTDICDFEISPESVVERHDVTDSNYVEDLVIRWATCVVCSITFKTAKRVSSRRGVIGQKMKAGKGRANEVSDENGIHLPFDEKFVLSEIEICFGDETVFSVEGNAMLTAVADKLREHLNSRTTCFTAIVFDAKESYKFLRDCFGLDKNLLFRMKWWDLKIGHWLNDPESQEPQTVKDLVQIYIPEFNRFVSNRRMALSAICASMFPLKAKMRTVLSEKHLLESFEKIEVPATLVLAETELVGMGVDKEGLEKQMVDWIAKKDALEKLSHKMAGKKFNINSPKQVQQILYTDLNLLSKLYSSSDNDPAKISSSCNKRRFPNHLKTNRPMLDKLRPYHPLPGVIDDWRKLNGLLGRAVDPILKYIRFDAASNCFRVNGKTTTWTATGRIAMEEPNLLGINRDFTVALPEAEGLEVSSEQSFISVRKLFVARKGYSLLSADYSQLELRILAHLSKDPTLISTLNEGEDVFKAIASQIKGTDVEDVTPDDRLQAKEICYGIIYGIGVKSLAEKLAVVEETAVEFKNDFLSKYKGIESFLVDCIEVCRKREYIETLYGRRRYLPAINIEIPQKRAHAERQATNSTIQGSAADLVKLSMKSIEEGLMEKSLDARLILQMHDELIYEVKEDHFEAFARLVSDRMEKCSGSKMSVKLPVKIKRGPNWSEMHELQ